MDTVAAPADLFDAEHQALLAARAAHDRGEEAGAQACHQALGVLLTAYERLLRETRRLVRRSDRAELEMTQLNQRLQELAGELEYRATHDPLTGVLNRAAIIERVNRHFTQQGLALIVLDIDHFKRVNDSFGHPVGDSVILGVVRCLKAAVPATAHIGRVGGEEFTVLLPQHDSDGAVWRGRAGARRHRGPSLRPARRQLHHGQLRRELAPERRPLRRRLQPGRRGAVRRQAQRAQPGRARGRPCHGLSGADTDRAEA